MDTYAVQANTQNSNQDQNLAKYQKKSRQGRRNEKQLSFLVDYIVLHGTSISKENSNPVVEEIYDIEYELEEPTFITTLDSTQIPDNKSEPASISKINNHKIKLILNKNNIAKKTLRTQLGDARDTFTKLAETNSQHLNNLSQSISQLASAMTRMKKTCWL